MLQSGDKVSLFVTVVDTHGKLCRFWAQTNIEACQKVEEELMLAAETELISRQTVSIDTISIGDVFLAKFHEDQKWYRAKVKGVNKDAKKVTVFFIDYGNEESIDVTEVAIGKGAYFEIPPQASEYILADIQAKDNHAWTDVELNGLREQLVYGEFQGLVTNVGTVGNPPTLRLFSDVNQNETIATIAISAGFGARSAVGSETVLPQTTLLPKKSYHVYVVFYESPINFWIQVAENEDLLNRLQENIAAQINDSSPTVSHVTLGTVCMAKFCDPESDYETFYRAVVTAVHPDATCTVLYVDYGNSQTLSLNGNNLKAMPAKFNEVPSQAIQCCLHGSLSSADDFQKMLESDHIFADVASVMDSGLHVVKLTEGQPIAAGKASRASVPSVQQNVLSNSDAPVHRTYKPLEFNITKHVDICISHVDPSGKFYCQLLENGPRLNQLMHTLDRKYGGGGTPLNISSPGTPCVTTSVLDPGVIYRSQVISQRKNHVTVQQVDFGFTEEVPQSHVFYIDEELMELPSQSIFCSLYDVDNHNPTVVANVLKRYESQTALVGGVIQTSGQLYEMELIDTSGIEDVYIIQEILKNPPANTRPSGTTSYHKVNLTEGQWTEIQVTYIGNPNEVYCQFVSAQDELGAVMEKIETYCTSGKAVGLSYLEKGQPCLARYSEDGAWYRALVSGVHSPESIDVYFIDFGNHDIVSKDCIKAIPPELMVLPRQCFRGVLDGLINACGTWTEEETAILFDMAAEDSHPTLVMKHEAHDDLYVIQMFTSSKESINEKFGKALQKLSPDFVNQGTSSGRKLETHNVASDTPYQSRNGAPSSEPVSPIANQGWAQWPAQSEIKTTEVLPGFKNILIETIVSPDEFYCRLSDNSERLIAFMDRLNEEFGNLGPEDMAIQNPKQGMFCCAKFDEDWYRAKILTVSRQGILVQYVDFGNTQLVSHSDIKYLKPEHTKMPAQAVKCALAGVAAVGGRWTKGSCELFEKIMGDTVMVGAFTECGSDGTYMIEVIQANLGGQVLVHEELVKEGVAISIEPQKPNVDQVLVSGNRFRHAPSSADSSEESFTPKPSLKYSRPAVEVGQVADVNVVHVETPTEFWVQLTQNCVELEALMNDLHEFYSNLGQDEFRLPTATPDMACIARFSEDESWYRAEVVRVLRGGELLVRYIDYGNYEKRSLSDLREIQPPFMTLPAQALQCSLHGIVAPPTGWVTTTKDTFEDLVLDKNLLAEIVSESASHILTVRLVETVGPSQTIIADRLVQLKLAVRNIPSEKVRPQPTLGNTVGVGPVSNPSQQSGLRHPPVKASQAVRVPSGKDLTPHGEATGNKMNFPSKPYQAERVPLTKDLAPQDVAIGDNMLVNIVWANSPTSFWCQKIQSQCQIQQLMEALNVHYETLRMKDAEISHPKPGQLCVALYNNDGNWYRSRVLRTRNREAEVLYVDFGNKDRIPWSKLKEIKPKFLDLPQLAMHCSLEGMDQYNDNFSQNVEKYFQAIMSQDLSLTVLMLSSTPGEPYTVCMTDHNGSDVAQRIAELEGKSQPPRQQVKSQPNARQAQGDQAVPSTPPRSSQPESLKFKLLNTPLKPGQPPLPLTVSNIESINSFYCQLSSNTAELDAFMEKLESHYALGNVPSVPSTQLKCGMPCVAQFSEDNFWYRAQVKKIVSSSAVEVLFVDYGNSEVTSLEKVRPLDAKFADYPLQAFVCTLSSMTQAASPDALGHFRQLVEGKELKGRITKEGSPVQVELTDPSTSTNINTEMKIKCSSVDKKQTEQRYLLPQIPSEEGVEVYISHVDTPASFWVQLASKEEKIQTFADSMEAKYGSLSPDEDKLMNIFVNAPCAAKFYEDGAWYRGVVEEMNGDAVKVRFIDYGNKEMVSPEDLKNISPDLLGIPPFGVHCRLHGLAEPSTGWTSEQKVKLENLETSLKAIFSEHGPPAVVRLTTDGRNVAPEIGTHVDEFVLHSSSFYPNQSTPNSNVSAYASHVEDGFIYIQLADDSDKLQSISDELQEVYASKTEEEMPIETLQIGTACVAKFSEDDAWYRAIIEEVCVKDIKVRFVDFGNGEMTTRRSLKQITSELVHDPPFAYKCQLQEVTCPSGGWPEGFIDTLEEQLQDSEILATFIGIQEPYNVHLMVNSEDVAVMVKNKFPSVAALAGESGLQIDSQTTAQLTDKNSVTVPETTQDLKYPEQIVVTNRCTTYVSHIENTIIFLNLASDSDKLQAITDSLQETYCDIEPDQKVLPSTVVGVACCAKFSEDEAWYRAVIEETSSEDIKVRFVDFGNVETTTSSSLKQLTSELIREPPLAFKCSMDGLPNADEGYPQGLLEKLEELISEKELQTEFVNDKTPYRVKIVIADEDVASSLLAKGENHSEEIDAQIIDISESVSDDTTVEVADEGEPIQQEMSDKTPELQVEESDETKNIQETPEEENTERKPDLSESEEKEGDKEESTEANQDPAEKEQVGEMAWETQNAATVQSDTMVDSLLQDDNSEASEEFIDAVDEVLEDLTHVNPGDRLEVEIVNIISPSRFWCQKAEAKEEFNMTITDVTDCCENANDLDVVSNGEIYGAKYSSGEWCRVRIMADEGKQVCAFYIDYGVTEMVCKSDLKPLPKSLRNKPAYAFPCLLCGVASSETNWTDGEKTCFEELYLNKKLLADVIEKTDDDVYAVKLLDMGMSVAEKLIEKGHAIESALPGGTNTCTIERTPSANGSLVEEPSSGEEEEYNYEDLAKAKYTLFFDEQDENVDLEMSTMSEAHLEEGDRAEVRVSHAKRFDCLFIQLKQDELDDLTDEMQEAYNTASDRAPEFEATIKVGLVCAAQSAEDDVWYRATLLSVPEEDESVTVQFIDYGKTELLPPQRLQPLKPKFHQQPKRAIRCRLHGSEDLDSDSLDSFVNEIEDKVLLAKVIEIKDGLPSLKLLDMGMCVLAKLIAAENQFSDVHEELKPLERQMIATLKESSSSQDMESSKSTDAKGTDNEDMTLGETSGIKCEENYDKKSDKKEELDEDKYQDASDVQEEFENMTDNEHVRDLNDACEPVTAEQCTPSVLEVSEPKEGSNNSESSEVYVCQDIKEEQLTVEDIEKRCAENEADHEHDNNQNDDFETEVTGGQHTPPVENVFEPKEGSNNSESSEVYVCQDIKEEEPTLEDIEKRSAENEADYEHDNDQNDACETNVIDGQHTPPVEDVSEPKEGSNNSESSEVYVCQDIKEKEPTFEDIEKRSAENEVDHEHDNDQNDACETNVTDGQHTPPVEDVAEPKEGSNNSESSEVYACQYIKEEQPTFDDIEKRRAENKDDREDDNDQNDARETEVTGGGHTLSVEELSEPNEEYNSSESQEVYVCQDNNEEQPALEGIEKLSAENEEIEPKELTLDPNVEPDVYQKEMRYGSCSGERPTILVMDSEKMCFHYPCFSIGEELEVTASVTNSPQDFWCQLVKPSTTDLPLLCDSIQDYCSTEGDGTTTISNLVSGMPCFSRCSLDGNWYRGLITQVNDDHVQVCYVDYGSSESAKISDLRQLVARFLLLNAQAFKCHLSGVVSNSGGPWDETSCARFEELVMDKDLKLTVVSKAAGSIDGMEELTITLHDADKSIADILVEGGYAQSQECVSGEPGIQLGQSGECALTLEPESVLNNVSFLSVVSPDDFTLEIKETDLAAVKTTPRQDVECEVGSPVFVNAKHAVIKEFLEGKCVVEYTEQGLEETVAVHSLQPPPVEVTTQSSKVFKCKLAGIETKSWTEDAIAFFEGFKECEGLNVRVVAVEGKTHLVYLYDIGDPSGISVNYQLVSRSFAWVLPDSELVNLPDLNTELLIKQQEELERSFLEVNEERRQSLGDLGLEEGPKAGHEDEETEEVPMFQSPDLIVGDIVELKCLSANDPETMICQLIASSEAFEIIIKQISDPINKDEEETLAMSDLCSGEACIVYSEVHNSWHRAKVLAQEGNMIAVCLVDLGTGDKVPLDKVRPIDKSALALPVQAVTCSVAGVQPNGDGWKSETQALLSRICAGKVISATVMATGQDGQLEACIKTEDGQDLANVLISEGLAEQKKVGSIPSEKDVSDSLDEASVATETGSEVALDEVTEDCDSESAVDSSAGGD